jgi:hypothetical protein
VQPSRDATARHRASADDGLAEDGLQATAGSATPVWAAAMVEVFFFKADANLHKKKSRFFW